MSSNKTASVLKLVNVRLPDDDDKDERHTLWIREGRFVDKPSANTDNDNNQEQEEQTLDLAGQLVLPGLIETHLHLDKACILHRCQLKDGTLNEAIQQTTAAKANFTQADIYQRAERVLQMAMTHGTTHIRTHVEIDPTIGLKGFYAIQKLQQDYAWAVTLQICVFPQDGLLNLPGTEQLLLEALDAGANLLGGCPYTDSDPDGQIARLFAMATSRNVDLDFHLDFDLDTSWMRLTQVCRQTVAHHWQGRVTIGHATKLSMLSPDRLQQVANMLVESGVQVTVLPSTDLFLSGRDHTHAIPRGVAPLLPLHQCGVTCSISSNNICNPFTPYGDASLVRQANLYANIAQLGTPAELAQCLAWVSTESAKLIGLKKEEYGLRPGCWADFIVVNADCGATVIAQLRHPTMGFKRGRQVFRHSEAEILFPTHHTS